MKNIKLIVLAVAFLCIGTTVKAQEKLKLSGWAQALYELNTADGELSSNTLRMRRVRMVAQGNLTKMVSYKLQADFSSTPMLLDAYVTFNLSDAFSVQIGQQKLPFTIESLIAPMNLEAVNYGQVITKLVGYSDVSGIGKNGRDLGITFAGGFIPMENNGRKFNLIKYNIGVFNGNGINQVDNNNRKDISGRLEICPLPSLTLTGSIYNGAFTINDTLDGVRNRYSFGAQFNNGSLVIRSEYIGGETAKTTSDFNPYNSNGLYAVAGYWFNIDSQKGSKVMPVLRYDHFAKNIDQPITEASYYTLGVTYWMNKSLQLKCNYSLVDTRSANDEVAQGYDDNFSNQFLLMLSYKF